MRVLVKISRFISRLLKKAGFSITRLKPRRVWPGETSRFEYQKLYNDFNISPNSTVLDIGSGGDPFPFATILTDRFLELTQHRVDQLVVNGKPFFLSSVEHLPLASKSVEFIYCSHLLEHVENPIAACAEIVRVGKSGYIETPIFAKDMLFSWAKGMHKWHLVSIANELIFFEYSERQLEGVNSKAWSKLIFQPYDHPLQELFYNNQDLFNVMFNWKNGFNCMVYYLDGRFLKKKLS